MPRHAASADAPGPVRRVDPVLRDRAWARLRLLSADVADLLPPTLRGGRFGVDARAVAGVAIVGVLAVALSVGLFVGGRPRPEPAPERPLVLASGTPLASTGPAPRGSASGPAASGPAAGPAASGPAAPGASSEPAAVVVDVAGRVRRPGVVRLPAGARVVDALRAAGGPLPGADTSALNLARRLSDGEQVAVGVPGAGTPGPAGAGNAGAAPAAGAGGAAAGGAAAGGEPVVDLNTATVEQLDGLPGVGPVLAQRIVAWRDEHGRFTAVEELREVAGIGERKFADLRGRVRV